MESQLSSILALARRGASQRAWHEFVARGLDTVYDDFDTLTLKGRLLKDRARQASGAERADLYASSGAAYEIAASLRRESYPLINAAAMAFFAGDRARSELFASKTLGLIESGRDQGETPYWREATHAEALLLLGRTADARSTLTKAIALAPNAWEDHAPTLRQFRSILANRGEAAAWLDPLRPPPAVQFSGIMGIDAGDALARDAVRAAVATLAPGFGYGALAAGADILAAEAILDAGGELHVVLPSDPADFADSSVDPYSGEWRRRYDRLLAEAATLTVCGDRGRTSKAAIALADYHAMGLVAEKSGLLECRAVALRMGPVERLTAEDPWVRSGRDLVHVPLTASASIDRRDLPAGELQFDLAVAGEAETSYGSIAEGLTALRQAKGKAVAIDCRLGPNSRIATLAGHASPDYVLASKDAAMALAAEGVSSWFESLGELGTATGALEIYALALHDAPPGDD